MKKKILIIAPSLKVGSGSEKFTSLIATKLSEKYNVFILTFFDFKNLYSFKGNYYSLKENIGLLNRILSFFRIIRINRFIRIYKFISLISPNIIISITDRGNIPTIITKLLFQIKIPLIISVRCNPRLFYKKKIYK